MYVPRIHRPEAQEAIFDHIKKNGFGTVIGQKEGKQIAVHVPLLVKEIDGKRVLTSHVAVANEIKSCFDGKQELLAIIMQQHAYVSSSWYSHVNVPTWNYIAVHIYGTAHVMTGEELYSSLDSLVEKYEQGRSDRFFVNQMGDKMFQAHIRGLVGFRLNINRIEAAYKLSQNRNDKDYKNIILELEKERHSLSTEVASEMKKLREEK